MDRPMIAQISDEVIVPLKESGISIIFFKAAIPLFFVVRRSSDRMFHA